MKHLIFLLIVLTLTRSQIAPSISCPSNNCCDSKTLTVQGSASLQVNPDQAFLKASIRVSRDTSAQAISSLKMNVNKILSILTSNQFSPDNYQTQFFQVYTNTSFVNGSIQQVGQIAFQQFQINFPTITSDGSRIGKLIDSLATIDGIQISGLSFDLKNKTSAFQKVRQLAFQNAQRKAQDYAVGLQLSLGQLLNVVDNPSSTSVVYPANAPVILATKVSDSSPVSTSVNVGTVGINYSLSAVYAFS